MTLDAPASATSKTLTTIFLQIDFQVRSIQGQWSNLFLGILLLVRITLAFCDSGCAPLGLLYCFFVAALDVQRQTPSAISVLPTISESGKQVSSGCVSAYLKFCPLRRLLPTRSMPSIFIECRSGMCWPGTTSLLSALHTSTFLRRSLVGRRCSCISVYSY